MLTAAEVIKRNNIKQTGQGKTTLLMAHGFGCDQRIWRFLQPLICEGYQQILFDYVGSGQSELAAYSVQRYQDLQGYAQDLIEIMQVLDLQNVVLVGHSVSAMIAMLAAKAMPERIDSLVMICPSPCFLNHPPDYIGGFEPADLQELLDLIDKNYLGWANYLAPLVIGSENSQQLIGELTDSFCSTDPLIAKTFAKATFFADLRKELSHIEQPTLILQSKVDSLASTEVGRYMSRMIPVNQLEIIQAKGHCLHMTHPEQVWLAIQQFLSLTP